VSLFDDRLRDGLVTIYARLGDGATFAELGGATAPCQIIIERDLSRYGDALDMGIATAIVTVRRAELPRAPRRGDTFTVTDGGEVLQVVSPLAQDSHEYRALAA